MAEQLIAKDCKVLSVDIEAEAEALVFPDGTMVMVERKSGRKARLKFHFRQQTQVQKITLGAPVAPGMQPRKG